MDLRDTPAQARFRADLRAWLDGVLPTLPPEPDREDWPARRVYDTAWQRQLWKAGYAGMGWPDAAVEGLPTTAEQNLIFLEETERAGAPYVGVNFVGLLHAGPTIALEGTPVQRARYLPPILAGEEVWCQGFSEPEAGSDLASLRTRAHRDGDHYVVSGSKIWTSHAQVADLCELLVRTDPDAPKHAGITWLVLPMDAPGVEVRPLRTLAGSSEFSEVFLDEVRIPVADRVGAEGDGWRVAMVTFSFERGTAFVGELLATRVLLADLAAVARELGRFEESAVELGRLDAELEGLWALTRRTVTQAAAGTGAPGLMGSVFKLAYSEARHRLGELASAVLGPAGLVLDDVAGLASGRHVRGHLHALSLSIAAGTTQIQRTIVGERLLGLPRER